MTGKGSSAPVSSLGGEMHHHRRVRHPVRRRPRISAPLIFLGVGAAILTSIAGFTIGSLVLGGFSSTPSQAGAYGIPNAPPGISFVEAEAQFVNATSVPAAGACIASNLGTLAAPTVLTSGASTALCLTTSATGYASGDTVYILEVSWNSSAAVSTTFKVQVSIDVLPATNDISVTSYVNTSATISPSEQAIYSVDMTQAGDTGVTQFAMLVTQL